MRPVSETGIRGKVAPGGLTGLDAARVFLGVVCCGRSAVERFELSINVMRRRIDDFEWPPGAALSLVEAFNLVRFPWFKDEFIHPTKPKTVYKGESLNHLFGGFSTEGR